jgi:hypothetical protein
MGEPVHFQAKLTTLGMNIKSILTFMRDLDSQEIKPNGLHQTSPCCRNYGAQALYVYTPSTMLTGVGHRVTDVDRYVIIMKKLLYPLFNILPGFIRLR